MRFTTNADWLSRAIVASPAEPDSASADEPVKIAPPASESSSVLTIPWPPVALSPYTARPFGAAAIPAEAGAAEFW